MQPDWPTQAFRQDALNEFGTLKGPSAYRRGVGCAASHAAGMVRSSFKALYRRFPTRAELIVAVCRQCTEACVEAGSVRL